jgi:hypothetical protein
MATIDELIGELEKRSEAGVVAVVVLGEVIIKPFGPALYALGLITHAEDLMKATEAKFGTHCDPPCPPCMDDEDEGND